MHLKNLMEHLRQIRHTLLGCDSDLQIGQAHDGNFIRRCSLCHQTGLFAPSGKLVRYISMSEAMDLTEYFES